MSWAQPPPRRVCFARSHAHHICTLWTGHDGNHEAWNDTGVLTLAWPQWPTEEPAA